MAVTTTIDGDTITTADIDSVELVEVADAGAVGEGRLTIDDSAGTIETVGHKTVVVTEDDCSAPLLQKGFVGKRTIRRGRYRTGAKRKIDVPVRDLNDLLNRRVIHKSQGKRPAETVGARMHWILGSDYLSGLVADNGFVDYPSTTVDKNDFTNGRPNDVIADCAVQGEGRDFFVYADPTTGDPSLWFRDSATSTDFSSTLKISNDLADVDRVDTLASSLSAMTFTRDPDQVFSLAAVPYARGTQYETKTSTASAFVERDGVAPTSSIKTAAKASRVGRRFLNDHDHETDEVNDTILVPSSRSGLLHAGMRLQAKYTHLVPEGYSDFNWYRVKERRLSSVISPGGIPEAPGEPLYKLVLRMVPQEVAAVSSCPYELTEAATFYPLGGPRNGPAPFDGYSNANPSDGVVQYARPGIYYTTTPLPGAQCMWHFPLWGSASGGPGTIDYFGDCVPNQLRFILVGAGTLTVQTEIFEGSTRPLQGSWGPSPGGYEHSIGTFTSGDAVEFDITDECVNIVIVENGPGSPCGGKSGWSQAEWVPA